MYIVYETTNLIDGKYYIGVHCGNNPKYLGSGKYLKNAIKIYGRETLREFNNSKDAYEFEKLIVDECLVGNINCYNICVGGGHPPILYGEDNHNYGKYSTEHPCSGKHSKEHCKNISIGKMGHKSTRSKKWNIYGIIYDSAPEAAKIYNVSDMIIKRWCYPDSKYKKINCFLIEDY